MKKLLTLCTSFIFALGLLGNSFALTTLEERLSLSLREKIETYLEEVSLAQADMIDALIRVGEKTSSPLTKNVLKETIAYFMMKDIKKEMGKTSNDAGALETKSEDKRKFSIYSNNYSLNTKTLPTDSDYPTGGDYYEACNMNIPYDCTKIYQSTVTPQQLVASFKNKPNGRYKWFQELPEDERGSINMYNTCDYESAAIYSYHGNCYSIIAATEYYDVAYIQKDGVYLYLESEELTGGKGVCDPEDTRYTMDECFKEGEGKKPFYEMIGRKK